MHLRVVGTRDHPPLLHHTARDATDEFFRLLRHPTTLSLRPHDRTEARMVHGILRVEEEQRVHRVRVMVMSTPRRGRRRRRRRRR